ncbi:MAG: deoxyribose-phosphate aldolase [Calditerrivibrio sp.]|nr:deoxyribose-phosphate aldolase [Calditerrivibrio sp.]
MNEAESIIEKIDITYLKPDFTKDKVALYEDLFRKYNFASLCIPINYLFDVKAKLENKNKKLCTVIGFPFGYECIETKKKQIIDALDQGVDELDIVFNIAKFLDNDYLYIKNELESLLSLTKDKTTKIIVETYYIRDIKLLKAVELIAEANADFVKTSTGFAPEGARIEDIVLIKKNFDGIIKIKASGGIKTYEMAKRFIEAGADRLGMSDVSDIISRV